MRKVKEWEEGVKRGESGRCGIEWKRTEKESGT